MQCTCAIKSFVALPALQTASTLKRKQYDSRKEHNKMCFDFLYKRYLPYFALRRVGRGVIKMLFRYSCYSLLTEGQMERRAERHDKANSSFS
jgi:hypothetical protein